MSDRERVKTALDEMLKYYDAKLNWEGTDVWANELLTLIQGGGAGGGSGLWPDEIHFLASTVEQLTQPRQALPPARAGPQVQALDGG